MLFFSQVQSGFSAGSMLLCLRAIYFPGMKIGGHRVRF